ncbi:MAG: hypothetical protein K2W96_17110 [Gemmataceae bacterium]|nr:hypothetical protein [Gemmataceae bacterium]
MKVTAAQLKFLREQKRVAPHGAYCLNPTTRAKMIAEGYVSRTDCGKCRNCGDAMPCVNPSYHLTPAGEALVGG